MLLVDDDESDNNNIPGSDKLSASDTLYRSLLQDQSLPFDTVIVPRYADGPPLEKLKGYSVILWYTGAAYGGNRDNTAVISLKDEQALTAYLQQTAGSVLLFSPGYLNNALGAGGPALWATKESQFLQQVVGIKGGRGLLERFKGGTITAAAGGTYAVAKSSSVETQFSAANPGTAQVLYTAMLDPDGSGTRHVAVATSNAVGSGRFVYVGFTFENVTANASAAFTQIMQAIGVLHSNTGLSAAATSAGAKPASFPRRARTADMTLTGLGLLTNAAPFQPRRTRTANMTLTGLGLLTNAAPFQPRHARTVEMTITGTGAIH